MSSLIRNLLFFEADHYVFMFNFWNFAIESLLNSLLFTSFASLSLKTIKQLIKLLDTARRSLENKPVLLALREITNEYKIEKNRNTNGWYVTSMEFFKNNICGGD